LAQYSQEGEQSFQKYYPMKVCLLIALMGCCTIFSSNAQSTSSEKSEIEKAVLNYVEAFYQADTTRAYESIVKDLAKRGYYTAKDGSIKEAKMSFDQLISLAKRWKSTQNITAETPRKVTVFDVLDKIASAKVEAKWGVDFFHLAKIDGKWMIINVLWQDPPQVTAAK
jgi:hypothetical protein